MKIRTIVVEDEPLARARLCGLLEADAEIEIVAQCGDGLDAVAQIASLEPDLVFLDIQLPELDGFQVLTELGGENLPAVVFVTAYDKFAIKAFEVHALDYLLKPFDRERFQTALARVKSILAQRQNKLRTELSKLIGELRPEAKHLKRLVVKSGGKVVFLNATDVDWLESDDNYVNVRLAGKNHLVRETLGAMEERLSPEQFVRISRSVIVNTERIRSIEPGLNGAYIVILSTGDRLSLSRGYRATIAKLIGKEE